MEISKNALKAALFQYLADDLGVRVSARRIGGKRITTKRTRSDIIVEVYPDAFKRDELTADKSRALMRKDREAVARIDKELASLRPISHSIAVQSMDSAVEFIIGELDAKYGKDDGTAAAQTIELEADPFAPVDTDDPIEGEDQAEPDERDGTGIESEPQDEPA